MIIVTFRAGNGNEWELDLTNRRLRSTRSSPSAIIPQQLTDWTPYHQTGPIGLGRNEFEVEGWGLLGFIFEEFVGIRAYDGGLVAISDLDDSAVIPAGFTIDFGPPPTVADLTIRAAAEILHDVFDANQWSWVDLTAPGLPSYIPDADDIEATFQDLTNRVLTEPIYSVATRRLKVSNTDGLIELHLEVGSLLPSDFVDEA